VRCCCAPCPATTGPWRPDSRVEVAARAWIADPQCTAPCKAKHCKLIDHQSKCNNDYPSPASHHRALAAAVPRRGIACGRVLIVGGVNTLTNAIHATAEAYDPATGQFSATTGPMSGGRLSHTALRLPGGKVMVAGGHLAIGGALRVEQFDPSSGTFQAAGALLTERSNESMTVLTSGKVLIAGGATPTAPLGYFSSAEVYDPADGSSQALPGVLNSARAWHTATLLADGTVLFVGGYGPEILRTLERFDPSTGEFSLSATACEPSAICTRRYCCWTAAY